jgi:hypothetical protein
MSVVEFAFSRWPVWARAGDTQTLGLSHLGRPSIGCDTQEKHGDGQFSSLSAVSAADTVLHEAHVFDS